MLLSFGAASKKPQGSDSPRVTITVEVYDDKACTGGSMAQAWEWARDFRGGGVPTEQCMRYEADDSHGTESCAGVDVCRNCMGTADWDEVSNPDAYACFAVPHDKPASVPCFGKGSFCRVNPYPRLGVKDFGELPPLDWGRALPLEASRVMAGSVMAKVSPRRMR